MNSIFDRNVDMFHKLLLSIRPAKHINYTIDDIVSDDYDKYQDHQVINVAKKLFGLDYPLYHVSKNRYVTDCLLYSLSWLPIRDISTQFLNMESIYEATDIYFNGIAANPNISSLLPFSQNLFNMNNFDFLNFIVTRGMAAHLLKYDQLHDVYYMDLIQMYNYEVRPDFLPYGAYLEFDSSRKIKYIRLPYTAHIENYKVIDVIPCLGDIYYPGSDRWMLAYNVALSTILAYVYVSEYVTKCHIILGGIVSYWHYQQKMDKNIFDMLKPFLYKSIDINSTALNIFASAGGCLSRIFAFTDVGLKSLMEHTIRNFKYISITNMKYKNNIYVHTEFYTDAINIWRITKNFVKEFIEAIPETEYDNSLFASIYAVAPGLINVAKSPRSNMIKLISAHIFNVSFWQRHVGNIAMYCINPKILKTKVYKNYPFSTIDSRQNTIQNINMSLLTSSIGMPKLTDGIWQACKQTEYRYLFIKFQTDLLDLVIKCEHLHPKYLNISMTQ